MAVLHPLCLVGIGAACGCGLVTFGVLALEVTDLVAPGRVEQPVVWADRDHVEVPSRSASTKPQPRQPRSPLG
jgi:hypothetical protein